MPMATIALGRATMTVVIRSTPATTTRFILTRATAAGNPSARRAIALPASLTAAGIPSTTSPRCTPMPTPSVYLAGLKTRLSATLACKAISPLPAGCATLAPISLSAVLWATWLPAPSPRLTHTARRAVARLPAGARILAGWRGGCATARWWWRLIAAGGWRVARASPTPAGWWAGSLGQTRRASSTPIPLQTPTALR